MQIQPSQLTESVSTSQNKQTSPCGHSGLPSLLDTAIQFGITELKNLVAPCLWADMTIPALQDSLELSNTPPDSSAHPGILNFCAREPISSLAQEFRYNTKFVEKVHQLEQLQYVGWRRIRGDGNCFYRAFGFSVIEHLVTASEAECITFADMLQHQFKSIHFEDPIELAAHARLLSYIQQLSTDGKSEDPSCTLIRAQIGSMFYQSLCNPNDPMDLALVRALRHLTAEFLLKNAENENNGHGASFEVLCTAQGFTGVEGFCEKVVLPFGVDAEGLVLTALPVIFGVRLRIAFIDRNESNDFLLLDYPEEGVGADMIGHSDQLRIHLQFRPGHYDMLYLNHQNQELQNTDEACQQATLPKFPAASSGEDIPSITTPPSFGVHADVHFSVEESQPRAHSHWDTSGCF